MTETVGTALTRFNALRHGVLSRHAVLPWEDQEEYGNVLAALVAEHAPVGATEEHLVEELAGIVWRKRRLRMAEAAAHRQGLFKTLSGYGSTAHAAIAHLGSPRSTPSVREALSTSPEGEAEELADIESDEAMTRRAMELAAGGTSEAYEAALSALRDDTREWWEQEISTSADDRDDGREPPTPDATGLLGFLERDVMSWFADRRAEIAAAPEVREQALGESLDPDKLDRLARYETHLDRKMERMLAMLIKLRELRSGAST